MISKVQLSLLQFLFLTLMTDAMAGTFSLDTTDLPDDPKQLKDLEKYQRNTDGFPSHTPYGRPVFNFRKASEELPDFSYNLDHLQKADSSPWDVNSDKTTMILDGHGDELPENGGVSKRGNRRFKQGNQKFRFDPALNRLGLGKRDGGDRPKYNPGWKFIGLGKRVTPFFLPGLNPSAFSAEQVDRKDIKENLSKALIPYYRILAMHDVSMFLDDVRARLQGNPRRNIRSQSSTPDHLNQLGLDNLAGGSEETSPKVKHSTAGFFAVEPQDENPGRSRNPPLFFTRSRKPTSIWRNKSRPMYDPGYLMTGLGK